MTNLILLGIAAALATAAPELTPYDTTTHTWRFDPTEMVSRNDVIYTTPSPEPWEAMPVGGGDLSAMVRFDGKAIHLHLTKSDAWGFQAPPDAPLGTRFFNNVSPGHVRIVLGEAGQALAAAGISQRLDLYRGRIVLTLGEVDSRAEIAIWVHPERDVLVVEMADPKKALGPIAVELSEWRDTMHVSVVGDALAASEVHTRPAAPHLATSGMEGYFTPETDPLLDRGTAVLVVPDVGQASRLSGQLGRLSYTVSENKVAKASIPATHEGSVAIYVVCAVTPKAGPNPLAEVQRELDVARNIPLEQLRDERDAWWRGYWSKSFLRLESPDGLAQRLTQSYYVHLYTLACTNRGPVPAKWDGGPGLMRGDERTWGLAEWVQEIRFTFLPLYAANRIEMATGLTDHYTRMRPFLEEQTRRMWGLPGLWIPETVLPWGGVEDWVLRAGPENAPESSSFTAWGPDTAPYGKFHHYNQYVGFLFACGPELCWHYLQYYRYSGDEAFLENEAYPVLRGVAEFLSHLLRQEGDGRYHLDPANGLETWWMARDPADAIDSIRWLFPEFIALSERYDKDDELRERCRAQLAALPEPAVGVFRTDGTLDVSIDAYAAAGAIRDRHRNFENPALYRVFPFGLTGIGDPDRDRAIRTFEHRIFPLAQSWSMDALWAARLGLPDQATTLLGQHTDKWNRFRYGGWDSANSTVFPDNLSVVPYNDGPGVAFTALHEMLLQSYGGTIRILAAVSKDWSGIFQLRAEGGFLVGVAFEEGEAQVVEIQSELGNEYRLHNPWSAATLSIGNGTEPSVSGEPFLERATRTGELTVITPAYASALPSVDDGQE